MERGCTPGIGVDGDRPRVNGDCTLRVVCCCPHKCGQQPATLCPATVYSEDGNYVYIRAKALR